MRPVLKLQLAAAQQAEPKLIHQIRKLPGVAKWTELTFSDQYASARHGVLSGWKVFDQIIACVMGTIRFRSETPEHPDPAQGRGCPVPWSSYRETTHVRVQVRARFVPFAFHGRGRDPEGRRRFLDCEASEVAHLHDFGLPRTHAGEPRQRVIQSTQF